MVNDVTIGHGPAFPVAFFDGEREMDVGDVRINPAMEYKSFQLILSKMIGISPNQISIYLVNLKRNWRSPFTDDRRRVPVTGKANFSAICRQKECRFLVILKRSRKSRIRRESMISGGDFIDFVRRSESSPAPPHLILLRRSQPALVYHRVVQSEAEDLSGQLRGLGVEGDAKPPVLDGDSLATIEGNGEMKSCCEDCRKEEKNGGTTSFHPCIHDAEGKRLLMSRDLVGMAHGNTVGRISAASCHVIRVMILELTILPLGQTVVEISFAVAMSELNWEG